MRRTSAIFALLAAPVAAQIPAFPGAQGYGAFAAGGRGGDVYTVTNLNDSGPGSFFEAISTVPAAGRTIVFATSGYIRLPNGSGGTRMTASKVTIAGQTAPGDGIGFFNNNFRVSGDDVILRHLRFRRGKTESSGDCLNLDSGSNRSMLDQLSVQFSTDENFSSFNSPPDNLTFQWSLNAWGLQSHSCGGLWDQRFATSHHNLWAHNHTRNPKARPDGLLEWTNNVTFDWNIGFIMGDSQTPAAWKANVIGNYFVCPPGNIRNTPLQSASLDRNGYPNFSVHVANNLHDRDGNGTLDGTDRGWSIVSGSAYHATTNPTGNYLALNTAVAGSSTLTIDPPRLAYKKVVSTSGALRLDAAYTGPIRDEVDTRLVQNLITQSRNIITRPSDLAGVSNGGMGTLNSATAPIDSDGDGMPDAYETALGWNPAVKDHNSAPGSTTFFPAGSSTSYTRLEEYLHFKSVPHLMLQKGTASAAIDLSRYCSGFSNNPTFTLANITGGTAAQSGPGGRTITFTANNTAGRGGFNFTVTDAEGDTWTRQFAIAITNSGAPADLDWRGSGSNWDSSSLNWLKNGSPEAFTSGDRVSFRQSGSAAPNVIVPTSVIASNIEIDSPTSYTFSGAGGISASNQLVKRGTGTATFSNSGSNSFSAVRLIDGTLALHSATAAGTAPIRFEGGALTLNPASNSTISSELVFETDATITTASQHNVSGLWTGANRTVTVNASSGQLWTITNHWNNFSGTLRAGTGNPRFRLNGTSNVNFGSANVALDLGSGSAQFMNRNGGTTPFLLGSVSSTGTATVLGGTQTGTAETTWQVGALNTNTTFAGAITNGGGATHVIKNGSGDWTLTGTSTHTGNTTVSTGGLLVSGTLQNSPVIVQNAALLGGNGTLGSNVTVQSGGILSPGTIPFTGATITVNGSLSLNNPTLYFDLSNTTTGANDRIHVGGNLSLTGAQNFQFLLLQGPLSPGTYDLIVAGNSSASGVTLNHNLPTNSRQSFALGRSSAGAQPSKVWLTVAGNPATLTWTGAGNASWDTTSSGNWSGASPDTFFPNDAVVFDDSATNRSVTLIGALSPRSITVNTTLGYTLTGSGSLTGNSTFTKLGTGTLTLTPGTASNHSGGTILQQGSIVLSNSLANAAGLGTGTIVFQGGTLTMSGFNGSNATTNDPLPNPIDIPTGSTGTLNLLQRGPKPGSANVFPGLTGTLSGGGTLNLVIKFVRGDFLSQAPTFSGTLHAIAGDADGGDFRFGTSYSWSGLPNGTLHLGDKINAYYVGTSADGAGTTIPIGELSGHSGSRLLGGNTGGRNFTYRIGSKTPANTEVTFAGTIAEQSSSVTSTYVKTGAGTWHLSGSGTWNGGTVVEQGTLRLSGTFSGANTASVNAGATLSLTAGSLAAAAVEIDSGALLTGYGSILGDLKVDGTLTCRGASSGTPGTLTVSGTLTLPPGSQTQMLAGSASDQIQVQGDLAASGNLHITLAPGTPFGRIRLISVTGEIDGIPSLTGISPGITAHLSTSAPGGIDLVIDDSDEDRLPDSWETTNFGNLTQGPDDDFDADGTSNLAEYRLGLNPTNSASAFRANLNGKTLSWPSAPGLVFAVKRSFTLNGDWVSIATITGPSAQNTATFTDPTLATKAFYKIEFTP
ncbi:MAG: autotransporter-associated beta strand repeat-containing protein [Akkermansiaceae bacterium]|jgi:autotransporter-associated beta strand protein|nr:autotransporter-associated beta strand repeat-containing protein [Akkermansiaceae bacterium]